MGWKARVLASSWFKCRSLAFASLPAARIAGHVVVVQSAPKVKFKKEVSNGLQY